MTRDECIKTVPPGWRVLGQDEVIRKGDRGWTTSSDGEDVNDDALVGPDGLWGWPCDEADLGHTAAQISMCGGLDAMDIVFVRRVILSDPEAAEALRVLVAKGYTADEVRAAMGRAS